MTTLAELLRLFDFPPATRAELSIRRIALAFPRMVNGTTNPAVIRTIRFSIFATTLGRHLPPSAQE
jgi:hypothetical protein